MSAEWSETVTAYTAWLTAAGTSPTTIRLRRYYLHRLAQSADRPPWDITTDDLVALIGLPRWKPETRKCALSTVRGFYRWAVNTGRTEHNPSAALPPVKVPAGKPRPAPEPVIAEALRAAAPRERLMILLGCQAGLRRGEIAALHTDDIVGGDQLRIRGKGGVVRMVPVHPALGAALASLPPGYLFPGQHDGHLSAMWVGKLLTRHLGEGWSAHTLRHRFATSSYALTRDLRAVQELLGHSKPETTMRYTAVVDESMRAAVHALPDFAA